LLIAEHFYEGPEYTGHEGHKGNFWMAGFDQEEESDILYLVAEKIGTIRIRG
jgi:hypothetical protein